MKGSSSGNQKTFSRRIIYKNVHFKMFSKTSGKDMNGQGIYL